MAMAPSCGFLGFYGLGSGLGNFFSVGIVNLLTNLYFLLLAPIFIKTRAFFTPGN
jgi:hypothetical protein